MANPRKFSEKIAMHNQKQAEETARFEQIMKEVSDATNKVNTITRQHLRINPTLGSFRGGSLPNVNHVANNSVENKTDLPNALSNFEELNKSGRADAQVVYRDRGRSEGVGPMRSRPAEKRIDTSPYGGGSYLSPPPDTNWRRTNSDSALHQSTQDVAQRRQHHDHQILGITFNEKSSEQRPRSFYEGSLVPGINIHPSHNEPGSVQIPIGNNTGSLPDLTCFHFPSPLPTPIDQEDHNSLNASPQGTSPSTLSPNSLPSGSRQIGRFPFGCSSPQESRVPSPHSNPQVPNQPVLSSSQRRRFYSQQVQGLSIRPHSPGGTHSPTQTSPLQNHLAVPSVISSYLHQSKGVTQDNSNSVTVNNFSPQDFIYQRSSISPTHVNCSLPSQTDISQSSQINTLNSYRTQQPNRPSPQNSPGLTVQQYRSTSPGDSHNSAPQSPASPVGSPGANQFSETNYLISQAQAAALQQHFEQFNMIDTPSSASITYITSPNSSTTQIISPEDGVGQEIGTDTGYYSTSPSQLQFSRPTGGGSTQQTTPQTPNTPSSIPDIILTDFSSSATDELTKPEFVKDLGPAMSGSFDSDFFPSDETLREGLGPIDFDGFQMLTDPDMNVISDPTAEDHFSTRLIKEEGQSGNDVDICRRNSKLVPLRERQVFTCENLISPKSAFFENGPNYLSKSDDIASGTVDLNSSESHPNNRGRQITGRNPNLLFANTRHYRKAKSNSLRGTMRYNRNFFLSNMQNYQKAESGTEGREIVENAKGAADTRKHQQDIKGLQDLLKEIGMGKSFHEKNSMRSQDTLWKRKLRKKLRVKGSRQMGKRGSIYLDYTNSQMPFNEGTKRKDKKQNDKSKVEIRDSESHTEDRKSKYSRVRRFLDQKRIGKSVKGSATLEAKEAAMSRELDPNLNLDGILEPHVRKRRYDSNRETDASSADGSAAAASCHL